MIKIIDARRSITELQNPSVRVQSTRKEGFYCMLSFSQKNLKMLLTKENSGSIIENDKDICHLDKYLCHRRCLWYCEID